MKKFAAAFIAAHIFLAPVAGQAGYLAELTKFAATLFIKPLIIAAGVFEIAIGQSGELARLEGEMSPKLNAKSADYFSRIWGGYLQDPRGAVLIRAQLDEATNLVNQAIAEKARREGVENPGGVDVRKVFLNEKPFDSVIYEDSFWALEKKIIGFGINADALLAKNPKDQVNLMARSLGSLVGAYAFSDEVRKIDKQLRENNPKSTTSDSAYYWAEELLKISHKPIAVFDYKKEYIPQMISRQAEHFGSMKTTQKLMDVMFTVREQETPHVKALLFEDRNAANMKTFTRCGVRPADDKNDQYLQSLFISKLKPCMVVNPVDLLRPETRIWLAKEKKKWDEKRRSMNLKNYALSDQIKIQAFDHSSAIKIGTGLITLYSTDTILTLLRVSHPVVRFVSAVGIMVSSEMAVKMALPTENDIEQIHMPDNFDPKSLTGGERVVVEIIKLISDWHFLENETAQNRKQMLWEAIDGVETKPDLIDRQATAAGAGPVINRLVPLNDKGSVATRDYLKKFLRDVAERSNQKEREVTLYKMRHYVSEMKVPETFDYQINAQNLKNRLEQLLTLSTPEANEILSPLLKTKDQAQHEAAARAEKAAQP